MPSTETCCSRNCKNNRYLFFLLKLFSSCRCLVTIIYFVFVLVLYLKVLTNQISIWAPGSCSSFYRESNFLFNDVSIVKYLIFLDRMCNLWMSYCDCRCVMCHTYSLSLFLFALPKYRYKYNHKLIHTRQIDRQKCGSLSLTHRSFQSQLIMLWFGRINRDVDECIWNV